MQATKNSLFWLLTDIAYRIFYVLLRGSTRLVLNADSAFSPRTATSSPIASLQVTHLLSRALTPLPFLHSPHSTPDDEQQWHNIGTYHREREPTFTNEKLWHNWYISQGKRELIGLKGWGLLKSSPLVKNKELVQCSYLCTWSTNAIKQLYKALFNFGQVQDCLTNNKLLQYACSNILLHTEMKCQQKISAASIIHI